MHGEGTPLSSSCAPHRVDREEGGKDKGCIPLDRDKEVRCRLAPDQYSKWSTKEACFSRHGEDAQTPGPATG